MVLTIPRDEVTRESLFSILDSLEDGITISRPRADRSRDGEPSRSDSNTREILFENAQAKHFREAGRLAPCVKTLEREIDWPSAAAAGPSSTSSINPSINQSSTGSALLEVTANPATSPLVRKVLEVFPLVTYLANPQTAGLYFLNKAWEDLTGCSVQETVAGGAGPDEHASFSWSRLLHPDDAARTAEAWTEAVNKRQPYINTFRFRIMKGEKGEDVVWARSHGGHLFNAYGEPVVLAGVTLDVSEIVKAKEDLAREKSFLLTAIDSVPVSVAIAKKVGDTAPIVICNRETLKVWRHPQIKYSEDIAAYKEWVGYRKDGTQMEGHEWPLARSILTGEVCRDEDYVYGRGDGTKGIVRLTSAPVRDPNTTEIIGGVVSCEGEYTPSWSACWAFFRFHCDLTFSLSSLSLCTVKMLPRS
jgi:PAS domain-containing protein